MFAHIISLSAVNNGFLKPLELFLLNLLTILESVEQLLLSFLHLLNLSLHVRHLLILMSDPH